MNKLLTTKEQVILLSVACAIVLGAATIHYLGVPEPTSGNIVQKADNAVSQPEAVLPPDQAELEPPPISTVIVRTPAEAPAEQTVTVSVTGAVQSPGVYELPAGARIQSALDKAGGTLPSAELDDINLAARLIDGTTLIVPEKTNPKSGIMALRSPPGRDAPANIPAYTISGQHQIATDGHDGVHVSGNAAPTGPNTRTLDLNNASQAELETLPGIGPKLASEIIRYRATSPFRSVEDLENVPGIGPKRLESIRHLVHVSAP